MSDPEKAQSDIERARKLYHLKDEMDDIYYTVKANDEAHHGSNVSDYRTEFMLKVCQIIDILIPEVTKVTRTKG